MRENKPIRWPTLLVAALAAALTTTSLARAEEPVAPAPVLPVELTPPPAAATPAAPSEAPAPSAPLMTPMARNAFFIELLGNGLLYSINYDRLLTERYSLRAGFMYFNYAANETGGDDVMRVLVPILLNRFFGAGEHKLEVGVGPVVGATSAVADGQRKIRPSTPAATAALGYRYLPREGGLMLRVGGTLFVTTAGALPLPGLSVGGQL